jgi:hypothetical protein
MLFKKSKETIKRTLEKEKFDLRFKNEKQEFEIMINHNVKSFVR